MKCLKDDATPLKVIQKLMINSVGERDYSAQETCRLLLQLPMFRASHDFLILSLDGSRQVDERLKEGNDVVTVDSQLDHYCARPATSHMEGLTLLQRYRVSNRAGEEPACRRKEVVVIVHPFCSPDPQGTQYEQYCKQKPMLHQPFSQMEELLGPCDSHSEAYTIFLQSGMVPATLADDIHRVEAAGREYNAEEVSFSIIMPKSHSKLFLSMTGSTRRRATS